MLNKFNKIPDFTGHDVFVGLDVHKGSWAVNIIVDDIEHRNYTQPPDPVTLSNYLTGNFPGANYFSAYESGFCGYHHHRKLLELGIQNIVINPADLPVTDKEKSNKRDPLDSKRISSYLQKDLLSAIHVFDRLLPPGNFTRLSCFQLYQSIFAQAQSREVHFLC